jgi:hypothetical protein
MYYNKKVLEMVNERSLLIFKLLSTHLFILPALMGIALFVSNDSNLLLTICQSLIIIVFIAGYWEFLGMRFRIGYSALMEIFLILVLIWKLNSNQTSVPNPLFISFLGLVQLILLTVLIRIFIVIFRNEKSGVEISFPFRNGRFMITDGGNSRISRIMNYHYYSPVHKRNGTNDSMKFATDIIKTGGADSFFPLQNDHYPVFGEKVFCPFSGIVFRVENAIEDNIPYSGNYPYNTGNTIVIRRGDQYMLLGHLKKGSIKIDPGASVSEGDLLAEAGNSGYSERPHIHMQLMKSDSENFWKGEGVPILFKGKNLYKNRNIEIE